MEIADGNKVGRMLFHLVILSANLFSSYARSFGRAERGAKPCPDHRNKYVILNLDTIFSNIKLPITDLQKQLPQF